MAFLRPEGLPTSDWETPSELAHFLRTIRNSWGRPFAREVWKLFNSDPERYRGKPYNALRDYSDKLPFNRQKLVEIARESHRAYGL